VIRLISLFLCCVLDVLGGSGGWNPDGCYVKNSSTENETVCSCDHLTSFAVLLVCQCVGLFPEMSTSILFRTLIMAQINMIIIKSRVLSYILSLVLGMHYTSLGLSYNAFINLVFKGH